MNNIQNEDEMQLGAWMIHFYTVSQSVTHTRYEHSVFFDVVK